MHLQLHLENLNCVWMCHSQLSIANSEQNEKLESVGKLLTANKIEMVQNHLYLGLLYDNNLKFVITFMTKPCT